VTSILNVIAGGGSFLTLPLLIFLGLPAAEANGTNRLGVLAQAISATWGFHRARVLDWRFGAVAAVPAIVGSSWELGHRSRWGSSLSGASSRP